MSKVYTINNGKSEAEQIPSIEYINELVKNIEDIIMYPNETNNGLPYIKPNTEELPVGVKYLPSVSAKDIKTDHKHKFVSDDVLDTLADKPTKFEVERSLDDVKLELKSYMDQIYTRIVNTPNVINKLRDISTILNEDKVADGILNTLAYKLNIEDLQEHKNSYAHINNNDRMALNIINKYLMDGLADWHAKDGEYNCIKNKPESLPANGGNADTVANHGIRDIINKDDYDVVIGSSLEKYSKDSCDIYAKDGNFDDKTLTSYLKFLENGGIVLFKRGSYITDILDSCHGSMIFEGVDRRLTSVKAGTLVNISDSVIKHITITDSLVYIRSNCELIDVEFKNCKIMFVDSEACNIFNCIFNKCEVKVTGSIMNNIIKYNRFIKTKPLVYIGGNNIISENI